MRFKRLDQCLVTVRNRVPCPRSRGHVSDFALTRHAHHKRGHGTSNSTRKTSCDEPLARSASQERPRCRHDVSIVRRLKGDPFGLRLGLVFVEINGRGN